MDVNRYAKLKAMSWRELVSRVGYDGRTAVERQRYRRGALHRSGRLRRALVGPLRTSDAWEARLLRREQATRFFAWQDEPERTRAMFHGAYQAEADKARTIAARVARHEVSFFGAAFDLGSPVRWHADPVTGAEWPRTYHRDVPCGRDAGCGDVKHVWELNRHQFLMDLGKVAFLDKDRALAAELTSLLDSWLDAAPYGMGAPWACALEPAFRAWSWLWAYHLLSSAEALDEATHLRWLAGFHDHGHFLYRHLEYYKSPYNHLIGEASALFALGLAFPEFNEARRWVSRGRRVLEETVGSQFYADGGSVEQSTFYHHATLGFYLLSAVLGRRHAQELGPEVWQAIVRGIEFSVALVQPDGRLPSIGGADDGKPIRLEHLPFWDFRPYYAIAAVLFDRGDFKAVAGRFWEDALWVLGAEARAKFSSIQDAPPVVSQVLRHSGYAVMRTSREPTADYVLFDCGPQAGGLRRDDVPSAAHGHADCLSVVASFGGRRVLVDPGFFCYNGEPAWEVHFRKTSAHNTIAIDGQDQARHVSKMVWTHTFAADLEGSCTDGSAGWASGSHDGYLSRSGVRHRRSVWLRPGGYLLVLDELTGGMGALARANFQFAPGDLSSEGSDAVMYDKRFELAWTGSVPVSASSVQGGEDPGGGWIAPSLGVRLHAPRLVLDFHLRPPAVLMLTTLADRERARRRPLRHGVIPAAQSDGGNVLAAVIAGDGWEDRIVASSGGESVECAGISTDAVLAVIRIAADGTVDSQRIGGSFVRVDPAAIGAQVPRHTVPMIGAAENG